MNVEALNLFMIPQHVEMQAVLPDNDDGIKGDDQTGRWDAVCFGEVGRRRFRDLLTDI